MLRSAIIAIGIATGTAATVQAAEDVVLDLPGDYRTAFDNYMISDRLGQEDQVISLYANETAREGARKGGALPDGSVLIGEIYKAVKDASGAVVKSSLGRRVPGELAAIVVMERQPGWGDQYPEDSKLGGWEFEVFSPAGENLGKDTAACRECHAPLGEMDFVFSYEHLAAAN